MRVKTSVTLFFLFFKNIKLLYRVEHSDHHLLQPKTNRNQGFKTSPIQMDDYNGDDYLDYNRNPNSTTSSWSSDNTRSHHHHHHHHHHHQNMNNYSDHNDSYGGAGGFNFSPHSRKRPHFSSGPSPPFSITVLA